MSHRLRSIKVLTLTLIVSICISEALIMFLLHQFGPFPPLIEAVIDVGLLVVLIVPVAILVVFMPLRRSLNEAVHLSTKIVERENQLLSLLNAVALAKDSETGGHIVRTQKYMFLLASRLQSMGRFAHVLKGDMVEIFSKVAPLHDIGKMGVPDAILGKAGKLTLEERRIIQGHTLIGESILLAVKGDNLADEDLISIAIKIAGSHHERWDGSGYPRGLVGEQIPVEARIMGVVDVYDALVGPRPYKRRWTHEEAIAEIVSKKNIHFDPLVVEALLQEEEGFRKLSEEFNKSFSPLDCIT